MSEDIQKKILSRNLTTYLSLNKKSQKEVADAIGVSPQTFNTWCQGIALPRMGKLQLLADYFNINKSDLIENKESVVSEPSFTSDKQKELNRIFESLDEESQKALLKYGRYLELESDGLVSDQSGDGDISDDKESSGGIA